jgi:hypothetical protein
MQSLFLTGFVSKPLAVRHGEVIYRVLSRALCNGKTLAFQAKDAGSIPAARSTPRMAAT